MIGLPDRILKSHVSGTGDPLLSSGANFWWAQRHMGIGDDAGMGFEGAYEPV